jgi:hypothetical protein
MRPAINYRLSTINCFSKSLKIYVCLFKMRKFIQVVLLFISSAAFSQTAEKTISKAQLSEIKMLQDLIPEVPKDCKTISYKVTNTTKGNIRISSGNKHELGETDLGVLIASDPGTRIYVYKN